MRLADEEEPGCMIHLPMSKFVCQHSFYLLLCALLKQCIVDDNLLFADPRKTSEVGIAMSTALAAIDNLQFRQGELKLRGERLNAVLKLSWLERLEFVKHGYNENGINSHSRDLDNQHEDPEVVEEVLTSPLDNGEERAANWDTKRNGESLAFDHICEPKLDCHFIEAEFLFKNEGMVI